MADIFKPSAEKRLKAEGHCLCGKVRFALDGPIIYNVLCHCENCRLATGSLFLCATILPKEVCDPFSQHRQIMLKVIDQSFELVAGESEVKIYEDPATQSTQPLRRHFCSNCGSNVFAKTPLNEDIVSVFAGSWFVLLHVLVTFRLLLSSV